MRASVTSCSKGRKLPFESAILDDPLMETKHDRAVVPLLVVQGARDAIDFYTNTLGAKLLVCYEHGPERRVSHADLSLADARFAITEEARGRNSATSPSAPGSQVVLQVRVADTDASTRSMCEAGATVIFPAQELLGERMARVRDPFGHLWVLRQNLKELSPEKVQRERDGLFARATEATRSAPSTSLVDEPPEDRGSVGDRAPFGQDTNRGRGRIHLLLGPVGAGKSTFARKLASQHGAVRLTLDEWMTTLFSPDRPTHHVVEWYRARATRCVDQIFGLAREIAGTGTDVVLEIGLLERRQREAFYARAEGAGLELKGYVLDAPRSVRRKRVMARNRVRGETFSMVVPPEFFELASNAWEPLELSETTGRDLLFIRTGTPHAHTTHSCSVDETSDPQGSAQGSVDGSTVGSAESTHERDRDSRSKV